MKDDFDVPRAYRETLCGQQFLMYKNKDTGIMMFASPDAIAQLRKSKVWKMDGTFRTAPRGYVQVYSVHGEHEKNESIPLVHILMKVKSKEAYLDMLKQLIVSCEEFGPIEAERILIDFETGTIAAIEELCAPTGYFSRYSTSIKLSGCVFHWQKCLRRKLGDLKLIQARKKVYAIDRWYQRIRGLPLLPLHLIQPTFNALIRHPPKGRKCQPYRAKMMKFVRYLRRCWLKRAPMWNHFDHAGPRTTNAVEGYHNALRVVTAQHPMISSFLRKLRQLHDKHLTRLTQLAVPEGKGKAKLPKYVKLNARTEEAKARLLEDLRNRQRFSIMGKTSNKTPAAIIGKYLRYASWLLGFKAQNKKLKERPVLNLTTLSSTDIESLMMELEPQVASNLNDDASESIDDDIPNLNNDASESIDDDIPNSNDANHASPHSILLDSTAEERRADLLPLLHCALSNECRSHLLKIREQTTFSQRHTSFFDEMLRATSRTKELYVECGGMQADENLVEELVSNLLQMLETENGKCNSKRSVLNVYAFEYICKVWAPEAVKFALIKTRGMTDNEAESFLSEYPSLLPEQQAEIHSYIYE
uniref:MULE transposase domain-containing protein n=1 Tax=Plectus sambesii TaxID=2011161 RepID=A0A914W085_9BILA